jgi:hypothetical protein
VTVEIPSSPSRQDIWGRTALRGFLSRVRVNHIQDAWTATDKIISNETENFSTRANQMVTDKFKTAVMTITVYSSTKLNIYQFIPFFSRCQQGVTLRFLSYADIFLKSTYNIRKRSDISQNGASYKLWTFIVLSQIFGRVTNTQNNILKCHNHIPQFSSVWPTIKHKTRLI